MAVALKTSGINYKDNKNPVFFSDLYDIVADIITLSGITPINVTSTSIYQHNPLSLAVAKDLYPIATDINSLSTAIEAPLLASSIFNANPNEPVFLSNLDIFLSLVEYINENGYNPNAQAFFDELPTQPESRVKAAYNYDFVNYPTLMGLLDIAYINVAQYEDNKRTTLVNPGSFYQSIIGTPGFQQFFGATGLAGSAYNTGWTPSTHGVNYTLQNGCFYFYLGSTGLLTGVRTMGCSVAGEGGQISGRFSNNPGFHSGINGFEEVSHTLSGSNQYFGLWSVVRHNATITVYHQGVLVKTVTAAAIALPNVPLYELAWNVAGVLSNGGAYRLLAMGAGSGNIDQVDLYEMHENHFGNLPLISWYGDSMFSGFNLPDPTNQCIPNLVSQGKGLYQYNQSISGTKISDFIASGKTIRRGNNEGAEIWLDWLINDAVNGAVIATFKNDYRTVIQMAIDGGYALDKIYIIKKWYVTDTAVTSVWGPYITAIQEVADEYGVTTFDLSSVVSTTLDGTHPNVATAIQYANYLIANT